MRYVIRADASKLIGTGHVMRTSVIAEELISCGQEVIFVGEISNISWIKSRVENLGFQQLLIDENSYFPNSMSDILILDSYTLPVSNKFIQKNNWYSVVSIFDDSTPNYQSDLIINPGIVERCNPATNAKFLTGPNYIPLRKSIIKSKKVNSNLLQILIVGGGTDSLNFAHSVVKALKQINKNFKVNLFTDVFANYELDSRFSIFSMGSQLDEIANNTDLVFSTASTSSLEFVARETAMGVGCAVENQNQNYNALSNLRLAVPIGEYRFGKWNLDNESIHDLINNHNVRENLKNRCKGVIDMMGTKRIVEEILKI